MSIFINIGRMIGENNYFLINIVGFIYLLT